jgi:hypothetical protein
MVDLGLLRNGRRCDRGLRHDHGRRLRDWDRLRMRRAPKRMCDRPRDPQPRPRPRAPSFSFIAVPPIWRPRVSPRDLDLGDRPEEGLERLTDDAHLVEVTNHVPHALGGRAERTGGRRHGGAIRFAISFSPGMTSLPFG